VPHATYLSYADTYRFSPLVLDYLAGREDLRAFYAHPPDVQGIAAAIETRKAFATDRLLLAATLRKQYAALPEEAAVQRNITLLEAESTFTICTAHQPNLGTGYLYFIYKILHAIRLADELKQNYPAYHFVPVYYIGSEDNDLSELGTFRYSNKKFVWDAGGQTGAVGRMATDTLKPLLAELFTLLGPPGPRLNKLRELLTTAYLGHSNIADATQYLVHAFFGKYGLVVLNPDDAGLKRTFIPVMQEDLLHHRALPAATATAGALHELGFKAQAFPRPVNLFYLKDNLRERIERRGNEWLVLNTDTKWNETSLLAELEAHPERFSPNVILRGLYQETILPNIAFIGGGAEVAYWLQLQQVFRNAGVPYPVVLLRQSVQWINARDAALRHKLGLGIDELFLPEATLIRGFVRRHSDKDLSTERESRIFSDQLNLLKEKAAAIDPTLKGSAEAVVAKIRYQLQLLEKKMLRAEKRRMHDALEGLARLNEHLFPKGGLQERVENFMGYYLIYGDSFFDALLAGIRPLGCEFLVLEEGENLTPYF
jgi:bacillithiol biosynthesis cysteine-adding enzyme BshC